MKDNPLKQYNIKWKRHGELIEMLLIFVTNDWLDDKEIWYDTMRTIFAEYNPQHNNIDVYTSAGYMLRIDC